MHENNDYKGKHKSRNKNSTTLRYTGNTENYIRTTTVYYC